MKKPEIDFLANYDDESLLAELRRIATVKGSNTVTKEDIKTLGRMSHSVICRHFGSLRQALNCAGLTSYRFMKGTDEELLAVLIDLWQRVLEKEGRRPQGDDLKNYGFSVSDDTIKRRFGGWRKALLRAHESITEESVSSEAQQPPPAEVPRKREVSLRKRFFVMKRDHFACVRCGQSGVGVKLEVHHRLPFAQGGDNNLVNLETLCYDCNRGQSDSIV